MNYSLNDKNCFEMDIEFISVFFFFSFYVSLLTAISKMIKLQRQPKSIKYIQVLSENTISNIWVRYSAFGIVVTQWIDNHIQILHAEEYHRPECRQGIHRWCQS